MSVSSLLAAINGGESLAEIKAALESSSSEKLNGEIEQLFTDVEQRSTAFVNVGQATLIQCKPEFRKQALTHKKLGSLCMPAGEKHLAVLPGKELIFARALESIGFILGLKK